MPGSGGALDHPRRIVPDTSTQTNPKPLKQRTAKAHTLLALVRNGPFPELITNGERRIPRRAHESIPAPAGAVGALCSAARGREQRVSGHPDLGTRCTGQRAWGRRSLAPPHRHAEAHNTCWALQKGGERGNSIVKGPGMHFKDNNNGPVPPTVMIPPGLAAALPGP